MHVVLVRVLQFCIHVHSLVPRPELGNEANMSTGTCTVTAANWDPMMMNIYIMRVMNIHCLFIVRGIV